jgi:myosin heavy subunit
LTYDEDFRPEDYADVEGRLELIEAYIEALEERGIGSASVNSPLAKGHGQGTTMTDDLITESEEEALVTEEAVEIPTEEVVKHDGPDELAEELATEESSEEAEAAEESEEAAEELEEETGEKSVLADLVSVIIDLDARLKGIENTIQTAESLNATISELKTTIATRDAELDALKAEKEAAEAEAALEAEVSKRVADRLASVGVSAPATPERKSLAPITDAPVKKSVTDYDPQPNVTPGMNGLATWLAENLAGRNA